MDGPWNRFWRPVGADVGHAVAWPTLSPVSGKPGSHGLHAPAGSADGRTVHRDPLDLLCGELVDDPRARIDQSFTLTCGDLKGTAPV